MTCTAILIIPITIFSFGEISTCQPNKAKQLFCHSMRRNGAEASMLPVLMQARSSCFPVPGSKQQRETKSRRQVVMTSSALRLIKSQRQAMRRHFIFIYHTCETVYIVLSYDTSFLLLLSSTRSQHLCLQRRPRTTGSPRRTLSPQLPAHASVLSYPRK